MVYKRKNPQPGTRKRHKRNSRFTSSGISSSLLDCSLDAMAASEMQQKIDKNVCKGINCKIIRSRKNDPGLAVASCGHTIERIAGWSVSGPGAHGGKNFERREKTTAPRTRKSAAQWPKAELVGRLAGFLSRYFHHYFCYIFYRPTPSRSCLKMGNEWFSG